MLTTDNVGSSTTNVPEEMYQGKTEQLELPESEKAIPEQFGMHKKQAQSNTVREKCVKEKAVTFGKVEVWALGRWTIAHTTHVLRICMLST